MAAIDPDRAALGREIRRCRKARELSQEDLAELAGLSRNYVGFLERGERNPTIQVVFRVARALGLRPAELMAQID